MYTVVPGYREGSEVGSPKQPLPKCKVQYQNVYHGLFVLTMLLFPTRDCQMSPMWAKYRIEIMRNLVPTGVGISISGIDCCGIDYYGIELPISFPLLPPHTALVRILLIRLNQIPLLDSLFADTTHRLDFIIIFRVVITWFMLLIVYS